MAAARAAAARDSLPPVTAWRIHIGAHKTATTHLQRTLLAARGQLLERGIDYLPLPALRKSGFADSVRRMADIPPWVLGMGAPFVRRYIRLRLAPLRQGPSRVLMSEENLLGRSGDALRPELYAGAERIGAVLSKLRGTADVAIFLTVRSPETFLPSAYAQHLRAAPPPSGGFDAIRSRVVADPPSWYDLVTRLLAAGPKLPLRVWRYEDYAANREAILRELCGCDPGTVPEIPTPAHTRSPGAAAIRRVEALPRDLPRKTWRERVSEIFDSAGPDEPRFHPFSEREAELLRASYARDIARIEALRPDPVVWFEPAGARE
jgi:hypothetical protein